MKQIYTTLCALNLVMHVRKISLIYRPKENKGHFPMNQDLNIDEFLELLK